MLADWLQTNRRQFTVLGEAWLAWGAKELSLWADDTCLACCPSDLSGLSPDHTVEIRMASGRVVGELRLMGADSGDAADGVADVGQLLKADAHLIGALIELDADLESMAAALGETEDQMLALYELTKSSRNRLDVDDLVGWLARQAARLVKAEGAFVLLEPDHVAQIPDAKVSPTVLASLRMQLNAAGHALLLDAGDVAFDFPARVNTLFVTPVLTDGAGEIVACLGLWLDQAAATLSPDLKLARSIAEQGGAQLEIALLHQELVAQVKVQTELELARQVQSSLLPTLPPQVAGLDIFGQCRPALQVGGDFYDFYVPSSSDSPHALTFTVGDVSGKGMPAALLMAMIRTTLRVIVNREGNVMSPESILDGANTDLYDDFSDVGMMASIFMGQFDVAARRLTYANAGHSPVILCPAGGEARLLEADGPFLGVLPTCLSQNQEVAFGLGDLLVVLSDGFNEAVNMSEEFFGIERLQRLIERLAHRSAREIGQQLLAEVSEYAKGHSQDDDQTIVVIKGV